MVIDDFGYEDLILYLAQSGMKIFLDEKRNVIFRRQSLLEHFATDSSEAQICLTDKAIEQGYVHILIPIRTTYLLSFFWYCFCVFKFYILTSRTAQLQASSQ